MEINAIEPINSYDNINIQPQIWMNTNKNIKEVLLQKNMSFEVENEIQMYKEQFYPLLDDFKKYYVFYNKNPEYDEYKNMYETVESQIQNSFSSLSNIEKQINGYIQTNNDLVKNINSQIYIEETQNNKYIHSNKSLFGMNYGSEEMMNNYKEIYRQKFIQNVGMFVGILFVSFTIAKYK
jgi:hypothetical protein